MSTELLPPEVGADVASEQGEIPSGHFISLHISGAVTSGSIEVQTTWDRSNPAAWRQLVEDNVPKRLDSTNTDIRVRGPLVVRVVRRGGDAIGATASNWNGNGVL